ncbi:MAG: hypothetical protein AAFX99_29140, partial [Myxococcota bacterium]
MNTSERLYRRVKLLMVLLIALAAWDCQVNCQGCCGDGGNDLGAAAPCATDKDCAQGEACIDQVCQPAKESSTTAKTSNAAKDQQTRPASSKAIAVFEADRCATQMHRLVALHASG